MPLNEPHTGSTSRGKRIVHIIFLRILPAILVLSIGWTGFQAVRVFAESYSEYSQYQNQQQDYRQTATAMNPGSAQGGDDNSIIQLVQFATNTPVDDQNNEAADIFATNTPEAVVVPSMTPIPSVEVPEAQTPIALPTFVRAPQQDVAEIAGTAVPPEAAVVPREHDLVNILLLGSDGEITADGTIRTDTMIIVSVNMDTRSVAMLSLPRDLFVYVPTPTMTRLNTVYGIGEAFGWSGGGFGLLRQTIFYNFGIQLHYYARIDISGMQEIIDTLGGVDLAVDCAYQDYPLIGAEVPAAAVLSNPDENLYTLPVGYYRMSGAEAMWYARTRKVTDDFDRGRRQTQLLRAIWRAAVANGQLSQVPSLWSQITQIVETDVPFDVMLALLPIGLELDPARIETFLMTRWDHTTPWQPPSGPFAGQSVQLLNPERVAQLMNDFYQPPTSSQLAVTNSLIAVYNGTDNPMWDQIAVERLASQGFSAVAMGKAEQDTGAMVLIDNVGSDKGSLVPVIQDALNISSDAVTVQPDADRQADYTVIVGDNYNSCSAVNILPPE